MPCVNHLCGDFINYAEKVRGFSPATIRTYSYVLNTYMELLGDVQLTNLTLEQVDQSIAIFTERRNLQPSSTNTVRCVLRSFFMYVDRYRDIRLKFDYSMIRQLKAPRAKIKFVESIDLENMLGKLHTYQDKLMMLTMYATGLRIGELVRLAIEDIHTGELNVRGKGNKDRVIPIDDDLQALLHTFMIENKLRTGPIFRHQVAKQSLPLGAYSISGLRKRWQRQLGPHGLYMKPHALRHGTATKLLMNGMDIRTLQTFLGHSHISTTMLYTHVTDKHMRDSYLKYAPTKSINIAKVLDI
jgi:site-specific recombinase XerD